MNGYWLELDHYQDTKMVCSEDATILTSIFERDRVVKFLARLNAEYDQVRVQVPGREKLPSLNELFSIICSEEYRRTTMFNETNPKGYAMVINKMDGPQFKSQQGRNDPHSRPQNQESLWGSFCKET